MLLRRKQAQYPVLLLTDGGILGGTGACLHDSLRYAISFRLQGIVCEASCLLLAPRIIKHLQRHGLAVFSYGTQNNEPEQVKVQLEYGINGLIVDKIRKIVESLNGSLIV